MNALVVPSSCSSKSPSLSSCFLAQRVGEVVDPLAPAEGVGDVGAAVVVSAAVPRDLGAVLANAGAKALEEKRES